MRFSRTRLTDAEGCNYSPITFDVPRRPGEDDGLALSFLYRLARRALELVRLHWMEAIAKDVEILVPRPSRHSSDTSPAATCTPTSSTSAMAT